MAVSDFVEELLKPIGLPVAYRCFVPYKNKPVPPPPYLVYLIDNENAYGSDERMFYKKRRVSIELYTTVKDTALENKVEVAISGYEFDKYEDYIDGEKLWFISYEFYIYEKIRRN